MKIKLFAFGLFAALAPITAQSQTLEEAVCLMLEFEPELNAAEYDTLSAREDQAIIRSERLPRVTLDGSSGYSYRERTTDGLLRSGEDLFARQLSLSIRQLVYDGGTLKNQTKAARNALLAQQYLEKAMIEDRVVDLAEVYLEIIRTRSQVTLAESNVRNHQRMRDLLKERANAGGSRADVSLVQGRLGLAVSQLATQKLAYQTAEARFERLVGRKPATMINPGIPRISGSQASIDLSNNFNYLAAAEALEGAEHRANAMKGLYGPRIYIEGRGTAGVDTIGIRGDDNEVSAQLTGTWDLYRGGYNRSMNYREHFQVGKFEELKRAADLERRYELDLIWQERAGSQATITALRKYADELSQVTGDYEDQFKVGRQELMNILDVQSEAYTARSRLLDAEFDYNTSAYRVLGVQGLATYTILGPDGCSRAFSKNPKEPLLVSTEGETVEPDNRVPVTQADLMTGRFDTDGPAAEYEDLSQRYYEERAQLPIQPEEDARPRGKFFRLFHRNDADHKPGSGRRGAIFK